MDERRAVGEKTLEILDQGWCQGDLVKFQEDGTGYCLAGALGLAHALLGINKNEYYQRVYNEITREGNWHAISAYNDAPERTLEEVKLIVKRALC